MSSSLAAGSEQCLGPDEEENGAAQEQQKEEQHANEVHRQEAVGSTLLFLSALDGPVHSADPEDHEDGCRQVEPYQHISYESGAGVADDLLFLFIGDDGDYISEQVRTRSPSEMTMEVAAPTPTMNFRQPRGRKHMGGR